MRESSGESGEHHEMGESARLLHELERSGEYVFHGSPDGAIAELEPRQGTMTVDDVEQEDGLPPGIATTPFADLAIIRALTHKLYGHTSFGQNPDGTPFMEASQTVLDTIKGQTAHVYVFPKSAFKPAHGDDQEMEWRSEAPQKPIQVVAVTDRDLPTNIKVIPGEIKERTP